jgi:phospholipid/cholesterol/gamma-HCH transport system substrate-binding protein
MDGLNRFGSILAASKDNLGRTLDTLPDALEVLNNNRANIVDAFTALGRVGTLAADVLGKTKDDFAADFKDLYPVVKSLAENSDYLLRALTFLPTFPFDRRYLRNAVRGDFLNVFATFDLTLRRLGESIFTTSGLDPNMKHMSEILNPPDFLIGAMANLSGQAADPFKIPPGTAPAAGGQR